MATINCLRALAVLTAMVAAAVVAMLVTAGPAYAATLTVNTTADDLTNNGNCTFREAIVAANTNTTRDTCGTGQAGADVINFSIPGTGPHIIALTTNLQSITETVTIDGYTQGDATATTADDATENTLPFAEDGTNAVIKIEINGASLTGGTGLLVVGNGVSNVVIRGLALNVRNTAGSAGLEISSTTGTGHRIEGNFIGTSAAGTSAVPNQNGLFVNSGSNVTIGGDAPTERNLISGNTFTGVTVNTSDNTIEGNIIGLDKNGNPLSNGNTGVRIQGASPGTGNSILDNSISSNGFLGIDLSGITANDAKDRDTGANNGQNFPVISSAVRSSDGTTTIKGNLSSMSRKVFTIQFFSNPSTADGEGKEFLGEINVRTNRKGKASFNAITTEDVAVGELVTATATAFSTGDTSEFSAPKTVG
jgi:CSLREA domain-containing protein